MNKGTSLMQHFILYFFIFIFSGQASAVELIPPTELPDWLQKELKKEKKVRTKSTLKFENLGINAKIKGKITKEEFLDTYGYYAIDIKTESPIECYIFTEFDGTANSLYGIMGAGLESSATLNNKPLTGKFNLSLESGIIEATPYLSLDILYKLGNDAQSVLGTIKGLSARTHNSLQVCIHNETGYNKSFFSVFESFVNAVASSNKPDNFLEVVYQFTLNNIPVGYGRDIFTKDNNDDIELSSDSSLLMPVDTNTIARSDSVLKSWSKPNGNLINTFSNTIDNGAYTYLYTLKPDGNIWIAEGESQGKAQRYTLAHKGPILSNYGSYLKSAELLKSTNNTTETLMWVPEVDPSSTTQVTLNKIVKDPDANIEINMGPMSIKTLMDNNGILKKGKIIMGPVEMGMKILHKKGQL